jgi:hypothetical protein
MITRQEAKHQAERCLEYHAAIAAGIVGVVALLDRRAIPWTVASLGAGVALHATCLFAIPSTRESLLRTTASLMEDRRHETLQQPSPPQRELMISGHQAW